jgi:hypothetical protein
MRKRLSVVFALFLAATAVSLCRAQNSTLTKATLFTQTTHEDKEEEVCVNVEVKTASGTMIAHAYHQDCGHRDRNEYNEGSRHQFDLTINSPGLARDATKGFKVHMWKQRGYDDEDDHDAWAFNVRVSLFFSSGEPLTASKDNVVLVFRRGSEKPFVDFANGD